MTKSSPPSFENIGPDAFEPSRTNYIHPWVSRNSIGPTLDDALAVYGTVRPPYNLSLERRASGTLKAGERGDRVTIGPEAAQGSPSGRHTPSKAVSGSRGPTTLHPTPAWVRPGLRLRGRGLARRPSCGRAPAAVGESWVGWGAAAWVP